MHGYVQSEIFKASLSILFIPILTSWYILYMGKCRMGGCIICQIFPTSIFKYSGTTEYLPSDPPKFVPVCFDSILLLQRFPTYSTLAKVPVLLSRLQRGDCAFGGLTDGFVLYYLISYLWQSHKCTVYLLRVCNKRLKVRYVLQIS